MNVPFQHELRMFSNLRDKLRGYIDELKPNDKPYEENDCVFSLEFPDMITSQVDPDQITIKLETTVFPFKPNVFKWTENTLMLAVRAAEKDICEMIAELDHYRELSAQDSEENDPQNKFI